jgi:hypothetical protein
MAKKNVYRVVFQNEGKVYEIYAQDVSQSSLLGFVEVEGLLFGERTNVVVDPTEEKLRAEFSGVQRTHIPMHAIVRVDQVEKRGAAKVSPAPAGDKVRTLPTPVLVPGKTDA